MPQRAGHLCVHCKAVARVAFKQGRTNESEKMQYGYAHYYRVRALIPVAEKALALASSLVVNLIDVKVGRYLSPLVPLAHPVVHFDPSNGGRPSNNAKKRRLQVGVPAADATSALVPPRSSASSSAVVAPLASNTHKSNRCGSCGEFGHNKRSCKCALPDAALVPSRVLPDSALVPSIVELIVPPSVSSTVPATNQLSNSVLNL